MGQLLIERVVHEAGLGIEIAHGSLQRLGCILE